MLDFVIDGPRDAAIPIHRVVKANFAHWAATQPERVRAWLADLDFTAEPGAVALIQGEDGKLERVVMGQGDESSPWGFAVLPAKLPKRLFRFDPEPDCETATQAALGWSLATYTFNRYKSKGGRDFAALLWPQHCDRAQVERAVTASFLVRDLINTPANDMGPEELAAAAQDLAGEFGGFCRVIVGEDLLRENYPAIHAVGRASPRLPRLIDLRWGDELAPKVTLVGKGVCFDSGGLDLKPSSNMKLMKKDMGGAAQVLGLARMIMMANLPIRLRVLVPAVENVVAGNAFKPMDVLRTRKGISVEVGNTDAEGRLVLCDALAEAASEKPDLLLDLATLTGAARSALGTDLPALFCNDEALAADLLRHGEDQCDPMWRLPLWKGYRRLIDSKVADLNNVSDGPYAGAITAALFLEEFVAGLAWAHIDLMAWNTGARPGKPDGGEAMTIRALFALLSERYGR